MGSVGVSLSHVTFVLLSNFEYVYVNELELEKYLLIETEDGFGTFKLLTLKKHVLMLTND